jgi:NTP pyrophosphatase (non-canonical NTP hydrolase)
MSTILSELAQLAVALTSLPLPTNDNMHYTNTDNPIDFPKAQIMDSQTKEVMDILQEECAEVIQAVSKISRFGLDNFKPGKPKTNREHLEEELGDLYAMIEILQELDVVSWTNIEQAAEAKREKLKVWSNIFKTETIQG